MEYSFKDGIFQGFVYAVNNAEIGEAIEKKERFGDMIATEKVYGRPIPIVMDFNLLGGITYFTPNTVEVYEEGNNVSGVHVEFASEADFVLIVEFEDFKENVYKPYRHGS